MGILRAESATQLRIGSLRRTEAQGVFALIGKLVSSLGAGSLWHMRLLSSVFQRRGSDDIRGGLSRKPKLVFPVSQG